MLLPTLWARAQRSALPVIGYLGPESPTPFASRLHAFRQGLAEAGYVEGRNVAIEFRWAEGQHSRLSALAAELVSRRVDVIVAPGGAPSAIAAKAATTSIPIVFEMGGDPLRLGLVESMSRPTGNLTGVTSFNVDLSPKRLQFLLEVIPTARLVGFLVNPTSPTTENQLTRLEAAARELNVHIEVFRAASEQGYEAAFDKMRAANVAGLVVASDTYFALHSEPPEVSAACNYANARFPDRRWLDELRRQFFRIAPPSRRLYGTPHQGRSPGRPSRSAGQGLRIVRESQDGEDPWNHVAQDSARECRQSHPVTH
jgi:hypothetical protein